MSLAALYFLSRALLYLRNITLRTPTRLPPSVYVRSAGRRAIPSTAAEGMAWKNLIEVLKHLRELKEQGKAGQLRDTPWADRMEGAVEGLRDTIGRWEIRHKERAREEGPWSKGGYRFLLFFVSTHRPVLLKTDRACLCFVGCGFAQ